MLPMPTGVGRRKRDEFIGALLFFAWINDGTWIETFLAALGKPGARQKPAARVVGNAQTLFGSPLMPRRRTARAMRQNIQANAQATASTLTITHSPRLMLCHGVTPVATALTTGMAAVATTQINNNS